MTRRRWIADEVSGNRAFLTGNHARHLAQVLRAKVGQEFDISTGSEVRRGRIVSVAPLRVEFELGEVIAKVASAVITAAISIFKFDRMEWAIEKCAELGVARIVPVVAARTDRRLADAASKRVDRWRRIAKQAAEQSRRASPPEVSNPTKLKDLVAATNNGTRILVSEVEHETALTDAISSSVTLLTLAFGPEGGWTEQELAVLGEAGWISASLGPTILRAETAVIAAIAICRSVLNP
jgi:16S rRNA (uracil1498-N3)-methyltransferase